MLIYIFLEWTMKFSWILYSPTGSLVYYHGIEMSICTMLLLIMRMETEPLWTALPGEFACVVKKPWCFSMAVMLDPLWLYYCFVIVFPIPTSFLFASLFVCNLFWQVYLYLCWSVMHKDQSPVLTPRKPREALRPANLLLNNQILSTSPKWVPLNTRAKFASSWRFCSAPDISMSSMVQSWGIGL